MVVERGVELLRGGDDDRGPRVDQLQQRAEPIGGQELGQGPLRPVLVGVGERRLGEQPVIGVDLGRRVELDPVGLRERALGEGREEADRLDLVPEQLDPGRLVLGRAEDVEDAAPHRELPAIVDLLDPFVAAADEQLGDVGQVDLLPLREREAARAQRRVGDRLGEGDRARDHDRRLGPGGADERVEGGDPQADEVRRRSQVGLIAGSARGVVTDPARSEIGAELAGQIAGAAIVRRDAEDRPPRQARLGLGERGHQERPQADGGRRLEPRTGFRCGGLGGQRRDVLVCMSEL